MSKRDKLEKELRELFALSDQDIPLGRDVARREKIVQYAVEAADELIVEFCSGTAEMAFVTAQVSVAMIEKVLHPLRANLLKLDLRKQLEGVDAMKAAAKKHFG